MNEKQSAKDTAKRAADRRKRQAEALRANLKRRKEAAKSDEEQPDPDES
jgi:hypothetical protein